MQVKWFPNYPLKKTILHEVGIPERIRDISEKKKHHKVSQLASLDFLSVQSCANNETGHHFNNRSTSRILVGR